MYATRLFYHIIIHQITLFKLFFTYLMQLQIYSWRNISVVQLISSKPRRSSWQFIFLLGWVMTTVNPALYLFIHSYIHSFIVRVHVWGAWVSAVYCRVRAIFPDFWIKLRLKYYFTQILMFSSGLCNNIFIILHFLELIRIIFIAKMDKEDSWETGKNWL